MHQNKLLTIAIVCIIVTAFQFCSKSDVVTPTDTINLIETPTLPSAPFNYM